MSKKNDEKDPLTVIADAIRSGAKALKKAANKIDSDETRESIQDALVEAEEAFLDFSGTISTMFDKAFEGTQKKPKTKGE